MLQLAEPYIFKQRSKIGVEEEILLDSLYDRRGWEPHK